VFQELDVFEFLGLRDGDDISCACGSALHHLGGDSLFWQLGDGEEDEKIGIHVEYGRDGRTTIKHVFVWPEYAFGASFLAILVDGVDGKIGLALAQKSVGALLVRAKVAEDGENGIGM
jgi:hypothetical protein